MKQSKNNKNWIDLWHNQSKMQKKMPHLNVLIPDHPQYLPSIQHYTICPYAKDIIDELEAITQMKPTLLILKTPTYIHVTLCSTSHHMLLTNYAQKKEKMLGWILNKYCTF
jgi:hypothetical protein